MSDTALNSGHLGWAELGACGWVQWPRFLLGASTPFTSETAPSTLMLNERKMIAVFYLTGRFRHPPTPHPPCFCSTPHMFCSCTDRNCGEMCLRAFHLTECRGEVSWSSEAGKTSWHNVLSVITNVPMKAALFSPRYPLHPAHQERFSLWEPGH